MNKAIMMNACLRLCNYSRGIISNGMINKSSKSQRINSVNNIISRNLSVGVDPASIKLPILLEETKIEMYKKYKHDPINWSIEKLSNHYHTSLERTRAVIYLMQKRDEEISKITKLPAGTEVPKEWLELYQFYESTLPSPSHETLSQKFNIDIVKIPTILAAMTEHCRKLENVDITDKFARGILARLKEEGVNTTFRETATENSAKSAPYFPELFGDEEEELEAAKKRLMKRVERETRASLKKPLDVDDLLVNTAEPINIDSFPQDGNNTLNRWKFAYLDLSKVIDDKNKKSGKLQGNVNENKKLVTVVRTRKGLIRTATPLEEAYRSWAPKGHISEVAMEFSKSKLQKYVDYDKDEAEVLKKKATKLEKYKEIKKSQTAK